MITYGVRSAVRDLIRVLAIDEANATTMSRAMRGWARLLVRCRALAGGWRRYGRSRRGATAGTGVGAGDFPRHLSQHVGGFVISEGPLAELVPVENATMPDRTVIQWTRMTWRT